MKTKSCHCPVCPAGGRTRRLLESAVLALLVVVEAPSGHAAPDPSAITAELRVAALDIAGAYHTLWLRTGPGRKPLEVSLNIRTFSNPIAYQGSARAQFFATPQAAEAADPAPPPLIDTTLQPGGTLLVFVPVNDKDTYRIYPIRDQDFPYGSFNFANFSQAEILVQAGDKTEPVRLRPTTHHVFRFKGDKRIVTVRVAAQVPGSEPRLIRQTNFSAGPDWREVVFFFTAPDTGQITMRHLVDAKPARE